MTVMAAIKEWAETHVDEVLAARAAFSRRREIRR